MYLTSLFLSSTFVRKDQCAIGLKKKILKKEFKMFRHLTFFFAFSVADFASLFKFNPLTSLPPPDNFANVAKTYPSKNPKNPGEYQQCFFSQIGQITESSFQDLPCTIALQNYLYFSMIKVGL